MSETTLAHQQAAGDTLAADERLATKEGRGQFWRATFSCWLGTAMEYVDFALYGLAAGMVFGDVFFPEATPIVALLASFATYSVGFVARPIGALVFGWIGDRKGRRVVLLTTVALMGVSTTLIGLIPSYAQIGVWAPVCLVILRFAQGFGAGAELSGGAVMLAEYAPAKRRGLVASIIAIGSNSGTLLASLVWLLVLQLDKADLIAWGWRIPFLASILIAAGALYLRRHVRETPVFERELQQNRQRMLENTPTEPDNRSYLQRTKAFWIMLRLTVRFPGDPPGRLAFRSLRPSYHLPLVLSVAGVVCLPGVLAARQPRTGNRHFSDCGRHVHCVTRYFWGAGGLRRGTVRRQKSLFKNGVRQGAGIDPFRRYRSADRHRVAVRLRSLVACRLLFCCNGGHWLNHHLLCTGNTRPRSKPAAGRGVIRAHRNPTWIINPRDASPVPTSPA